MNTGRRGGSQNETSGSFQLATNNSTPKCPLPAFSDVTSKIKFFLFLIMLGDGDGENGCSLSLTDPQVQGEMGWLGYPRCSLAFDLPRRRMPKCLLQIFLPC